MTDSHVEKKSIKDVDMKHDVINTVQKLCARDEEGILQTWFSNTTVTRCFVINAVVQSLGGWDAFSSDNKEVQEVVEDRIKRYIRGVRRYTNQKKSGKRVCKRDDREKLKRARQESASHNGLTRQSIQSINQYSTTWYKFVPLVYNDNVQGQACVCLHHGVATCVAP